MKQNKSQRSFTELGVELPQKIIKPNPRQLPIDLIYSSLGNDGRCCMAVHAGWKYGIQSLNGKVITCSNISTARHKVVFVDNDYWNYDHETHLKVVKKYQPKYATVRDIMTEKQCKQSSRPIEYHPLDLILEWSKELEQYAKNVILIPKYDCLDKLPERYVLGYSIPTSHGGTPISPEAFKDHKVHLLGGSWKQQLKYLELLIEEVVSIDNNMISKISLYGSFNYPDGTNGDLIKDLGIDFVTNKWAIALSISFGAIAHKINQIYGSA